MTATGSRPGVSPSRRQEAAPEHRRDAAGRRRSSASPARPKTRTGSPSARRFIGSSAERMRSAKPSGLARAQVLEVRIREAQVVARRRSCRARRRGDPGRATPGSGYSRIVSTQLKIVVLAPMPSPRISTATAVNAGTADDHPPGELQVVERACADSSQRGEARARAGRRRRRAASEQRSARDGGRSARATATARSATARRATDRATCRAARRHGASSTHRSIQSSASRERPRPWLRVITARRLQQPPGRSGIGRSMRYFASAAVSAVAPGAGQREVAPRRTSLACASASSSHFDFSSPASRAGRARDRPCRSSGRWRP